MNLIIRNPDRPSRVLTTRCDQIEGDALELRAVYSALGYSVRVLILAADEQPVAASAQES